NVNIGNNENSTATINIDGANGILNVTKGINIGSANGSTAIVNLKNGTFNANDTGNTFINVGANANAKKAELNVSGGTLNVSKLNINNSSNFTMTGGNATISSLIFSDNSTGNVGGTTNITTLKLWKNAVAELSGTHTISEISVDDNTELIITGTVGGNGNNVTVGVIKQGVLTIDGGSLTTDGVNVRKNAVLNIIGGGKLTTNNTLRTSSSNDKMEAGSPTVNVIDGTWTATSWIGHGYNVNSGVINVFSKGSVIHTNAGAWWPVGDGGTAIINLYKGGTIDTAKIGFMKDGTILNFVPTAAESWNFTANTLTFDGNAKTTFGEVNGITAFNDENYQIVLTNASGNPNVQSNDYWDVAYDDTTKTLSASLKKDVLTWTTPWKVACATVDDGVSGLADLSMVEADDHGNYTFELFLHGVGDRDALADYFTESLALFTGMDAENGKFEYLGDGMEAISYIGSSLSDYFYWDLAAYNLANNTSFSFGAVPEPSTVCLLLVGLAGVRFLRRKK
ncbi:MAG: PEP-CTERM sorting domain-containing protein, partial [Planctomycetia bacterium]|nr:PEP-CTERM sorting domain-containing protein [Planctomycetia bacterium]